MKLPKLHIGAWWRPLGLAVVLAFGLVTLLIFQLTTLAPRLSPTEASTVAASSQYHLVVTNPLNLPQKTLTWLTLKLPQATRLWQARLPSIIFGFGCFALMAYVLHRWYGRRSMLFGLALFATSAWFLHVTRFASPDSEYLFAVLALLAAHINLRDHEDSRLAWCVWVATHALLLLIPGFVWFILLSAAWQWRVIGHAWSAQGLWQRLLTAVLPLASVAALVTAFLLKHQLVFTWLGMTRSPSLATLTQLPHHLLDAILLIGWRGPHRPELWLGQLPLLDAFMVIMLLAGILFYARHWQAARARLLASYLGLGVILISLGVVSISVLVPMLYIIAVAGIAFVLQFWLRVFPRNPIARSFGIGLIAVLVGSSCYYSLTQVFIAWPHNPEVERVYQTSE